ncbi:MAG: rod shape-determining protein RodA [Candidatus Buchananbacteria bacterium]|nr:rod shape-determining protein RodA [Candidatus Buchananbacteria bacterium]
MPIFRRYLSYFRNFDWVLFGAVLLLIAFSLAALYSIAISSETPNFSNFNKQIIFAVIGIIFVFIFSLVDYRFWLQFSHFFYGISALLLLAVLFFGRTVSGTTGWFTLPGFSFQPVEVAKLALIATLAWFLSQKIGVIKETKNFIISGAFTFLLFGLVMLQPDFGSGMVLFVIWFIMMYLAGADRKHLLSIIALIVLGGLISWLFLFQPYQKDRIMTFFNPNSDPYGRGYQVRQAIVAVGAGGLLGRGLGFGSQSQLKFIPASQTDFIFAVIGEELGFLGVGLVLFLWVLIFFRLYRAISRTSDSFAAFFIIGLSILFFSQIFVNIGMNVGIVPVTGIPLPFVSYGGSFLVVSLMSIGVVESMVIRSRG